MSIKVKPFFYEASVALSEDSILHLVLDFPAVDRLERLMGISIDDVIGEMLKSVSQMVKVLWGVTRRDHSDIDFDHLAGILMPGAEGNQETAQAVIATLGDLFRRAFPVGVEAPLQPAKPRKRRNG